MLSGRCKRQDHEHCHTLSEYFDSFNRCDCDCHNDLPTPRAKTFTSNKRYHGNCIVGGAVSEGLGWSNKFAELVNVGEGLLKGRKIDGYYITDCKAQKLMWQRWRG
jgi:hypothetical protein